MEQPPEMDPPRPKCAGVGGGGPPSCCPGSLGVAAGCPQHPATPPVPRCRSVNKGSDAARYSPRNPQWWLAGSTHPYAPFVGNALKWESYVYDDGTT